MLKQRGLLDQGCRDVLVHCPIAAFGYRADDGVSRTTFIGGTPGFVRVRSDTRFTFSLSESAAPQGPASFFFLMPGIGEVLRVNGSVVARKGAHTTVEIDQVYVHCAQAVLRARLWQPPVPAAAPTVEVGGRGPLSRPIVAQFLAASPFLALSTWDCSGGSDTSPRGDRQAVARMLNGHTLAIPDRRGNKRADALHNLVQNDRLSFAALVPGRSGVLHGRGRGSITDDRTLLETVALRGVVPHAALLIDVEDAEVTDNDAVVRSRLWTSDALVDRRAVPDLMALVGKQVATDSTTTDGRRPGLLLKAIGKLPGAGRMWRLGMNHVYRVGLRKEGYEDIEERTDGRRFLRRRRRHRTSS